MAITYELLIRNMHTTPSEGSYQDVVKIIHWAYIGEETVDGINYNGSATGAVEVNVLNTGSFTSFSDLTENQVKSWVEPKLDLVKIKADVDSQIEVQKIPSTIEAKLSPWSND